MDKITSEEVLKMVNEISEKNNPALQQYLDSFFTKYTDIEYLKDLSLTGEEHLKIEAALVGLVKVSTITSIEITLQILDRLGVLEKENIR